MTENSASEPPPLVEPQEHKLTVTIKSVEGLNFGTELGNQQIAASILFPGHQLDMMSQLVPPAPKITFDFTETFDIKFYPNSTINALLQAPLEFFVYVCTQDLKRTNQVAKFTFGFDQLLYVTSYTAILDGTVLPDGAQILPAEGIKASINFAWDSPIIEPEDFEQTLIASLNLSPISALPQAIVNSNATPNNFGTHIFSYILCGTLPNGQVIFMDNGKLNATNPDGSDAQIVFPNPMKFYVGPEDFAKWKETAEKEENISVYLIPELTPILQPLGLLPSQYDKLYARAEIPFSQFSKAGRSHFLGQTQLFTDPKYSVEDPPMPNSLPNGFPEEPVDPTGRRKVVAKKGLPSSRSSAKTKQGANTTASTKKAKALSAKDKKLQQTILQIFQGIGDSDVYKDSATQIRIELALSRPLVPRSATPIESKPPEEVVRPLPKMHANKLANATKEFCRQVNIAITQLSESQNRDELRKIIKEQLKPSVVEVVQQVYLNKPEPSVEASKKNEAEDKQEDKENKEAEIGNAFISELRSYLILHLNKVVNQRFKLTFPSSSLSPPEMDIDCLSRRIASQKLFKTDDLGALHQKRCQLDPLNPQWPYEYALYLSDIKDEKALDNFARAISIDYHFKAAILGFCSLLVKNGNKSDALVLLDMLGNEMPTDPTVTVCQSLVYTLLESSKCDEFLAKISNMAQSLNRSPYLIAASSLIDVHDTFVSEMALSKERTQGQRTKELLILLAKFSQLTGDPQRAQEYLKEAIEMDQEDLSVWKMLGEFQFESGMFDKAKASFTSLLTLSDDPDPASCLKLALIKVKDGEYAAAYDLLMFTVQKLDDVLAWLALGVCCFRMEEYTEADSCFVRASELDRWNAVTWGYCTLLCFKTGDHVKACQALIYTWALGIKDKRLIDEIIVEAEKAQIGEKAKEILAQMKQVKEEDCYPPFENQSN